MALKNSKKDKSNSKKTDSGEISLPNSAKKNSRNDFIVKIVCVFSAFLLWLYVMTVDSPNDEHTIDNIPVQLINVDVLERDSKLSVYNGEDNYVSVTVSGKRSVVSKLTADDIVATADVSSIQRAAQTSVKINVALPDNCTFVSISQSNISIKADNFVERNVDIYGNLLNRNALYVYDEEPTFRSNSGSSSGVTTDSYVVDSVIVSGPESIVDEIEKAVVDIDLRDRDSKFTELLPLYLVDSANKKVFSEYLSTSFSFVQVTMPVFVTRSVPVDILFRQRYLSNTNSKITVEPESIVVTCDPADADKADLLDSIFIDERRSFTRDNIAGHYYEADFNITSPYNVRISNSQVKVKIDIDENIQLREIDVVEIQKTNGFSVDCNILTDSVDDVILCGPKAAIAGIKLSDIIAIVDLGGYSEENIGKRYTKSVTIEIDSEDAENVFVLGEYTVEIEITGK